ncbi:MAG: hypothetical protein ACP5IF_06150 [Conexivisphaera sp.]|jgi:hypothetical protein
MEPVRGMNHFNNALAGATLRKIGATIIPQITWSALATAPDVLARPDWKMNP